MFDPVKKQFIKEATDMVDKELILMGVTIENPLALGKVLLKVGEKYKEYLDNNKADF